MPLFGGGGVSAATSGLKVTGLANQIIFLAGIQAVGTDAIGTTRFIFDNSNGGQFRVTPGAVTIPTSVELSDIVFDLSHQVTWTTITALAEMAAIRIKAPTYNETPVGKGSDIVQAATLLIENAPIVGTNMTIGESMALWVKAGKARFDGITSMIGGVTFLGGINIGGGVAFTDALGMDLGGGNITNVAAIQATGLTQTGNIKYPDVATIFTVNTVDATITVLGTGIVVDNRITQVRVMVLGYNSTTAASQSSVVLIGSFRSTAGVAAQVGATTVVASHIVGGGIITLDATGNTWRIRVQGIAANNYAWKAIAEVISWA